MNANLGPMFHGTVHPFKPGDIVEPRKGNPAYATPDIDYAHQRADQAVDFTWEDLKKVNPTWNKPGGKQYNEYEAETPPRVYQVEPLDPEEVQTTSHGEDLGNFVSQKGFRVIKQVK